MERDGKSSGNNVVDQQTQTPGDGVSITFRSQLKNATRNIKNRWSSSGADAATGIMTGNLTRFFVMYGIITVKTSIQILNFRIYRRIAIFTQWSWRSSK